MPKQTDRTAAIKSYCRVCTVQCGVVMDVEDGRVVKVRGDREHPLSRGYTCSKGRAIGQWHEDPDALTHPAIQVDGVEKQVSWDNCLDDLAGKLSAVIEQHGPGAVGFFFGSGIGINASGYRMAEAFYQALGTPPKFTPTTIDGTAKIMVSSLVGGFPGLIPKIDVENVDMLLFVGSNPMVSHGHNNGMFNPAVHIRGTARRGEVWTIDPLLTETAKFSTRHIAPYPGTDYAILAWLAGEIAENGPLDPAQPITGLDDLKKALQRFDRKTAASIAGVDENDLTDLLSAIRKKGKVVVETGTGVTMSRSANITHWLSWVLMILTGAMNRPGGIWFHPGFLTPFDGSELPIVDDPFTPGPPTMPGVKGLLGEWACAALPGEIAAGNIHALVNLGGSLVRSFPDTNTLEPALRALDVCATFEIGHNETTALSTHLLPIKDQIERPDIALWDILSSRVSMQYTPAIVPVRGERRSAWWIIAQLMQRMGFQVPDDLPDDDLTEGADDAMLARMLDANARCTFDDVAATGYVEKPLQLPSRWVDLHIGRMGGWKLAPPPLLNQLSQLRNSDLEPGAPGSLRFISRRQRRKLNASLDFLGSPADIILNPADAAARGIAHGQKVRVYNDKGEVTLTANLDETIRNGVASIPHGHGSANVNNLTSAQRVDPLGGQVLYTGIPIEVEPASA